MEYSNLLNEFFKNYATNATIDTHKISGVLLSENDANDKKSDDNFRLGVGFEQDVDFVFLTANSNFLVKYKKIIINNQNYIITKIKPFYFKNEILYFICNLKKS
ncbi:MAG: hypothetical protein RSA99_00520 [Oscillospiraceae bacterium]